MAGGSILESEPVNNWLFTKEQIIHTPSRVCGLDEDEETILRDKGCRVIASLAKEVNRYPALSQVACLYFHRVYMRKSFTDYNEYKLIAVTCFWIAAKWDDYPIKSAHITELAVKIVHKDFQIEVDFESPLFMEYRRRILYYEIELYRVLCFDRLPRGPFNVLVSVIPQLDVDPSTAIIDAAATAINDIYLSTVCLRFTPAVLVATAIVFAAKMIHVDIPRGKDGLRFRQVTGIDSDEGLESLRAAIVAVKEFYVNHRKPDEHEVAAEDEEDDYEMRDQPLQSASMDEDTAADETLARAASQLSVCDDDLNGVASAEPADAHGTLRPREEEDTASGGETSPLRKRPRMLETQQVASPRSEDELDVETAVPAGTTTAANAEPIVISGESQLPLAPDLMDTD
ncbi:hypothetical protein HDU87_000160 [Geranomyces variabilis]|uniref:Cyclin N-terminal domain-containing protein n=1 Tax=Geranomyces variabilis TaxID=109894 RepID=A0AAD5TU05_9FUNG|nr:hypothetical protein HDU87_000160 [Geranomyces variabilis]